MDSSYAFRYLERVLSAVGRRPDRDDDVFDAEALTSARFLEDVAASEAASTGSICPDLLEVLGRFHWMRYLALHAQTDYETTASALGRAVRFFSLLERQVPGAVPRELAHFERGIAARQKFDESPDIAHLKAAISAFRESYEATHPGHPYRAKSLINLSLALLKLYEHTGEAGSLQRAVAAGRCGLASAPPNVTERREYLSTLARCFETRCIVTGSLADANEAVRLSERAVQCASDGDDWRHLITFASALRTRYRQSGVVDDLHRALGCLRRVDGDVRPEGRGPMLTALAQTLLVVAELGHSASALSEASAAVEKALTETQASDVRWRARARSILSTVSLASFTDSGEWRYLDQAAIDAVAAVKEAPSESPEKTVCLANVGVILLVTFEVAGRISDLDESIRNLREALRNAGPQSPPTAAIRTNLAFALLTRYERAGGDRTDLEEAEGLAAEALEGGLISSDAPSAMTNMGNVYSAKFGVTSQPADLDLAIDWTTKAIAASKYDREGLASRWSNLGNLYSASFSSGAGDRSTLDKAISAGRKAVAAANPSHYHYARYLCNVAESMYEKYQTGMQPADIEETLRMGEDAVLATAADSPERPRHLLVVGKLHLARFRTTARHDDYARAVSAWKAASEQSTGYAFLRSRASRLLGDLLGESGDFKAALRSYALAVTLQSSVAWHGLNRATRLRFLAEMSGCASDAAYCAILAGTPQGAVSLLERGRAVLWAQALNLRTDFSDLAVDAPALAKRLDELRKLLDSPYSPSRSHLGVHDRLLRDGLDAQPHRLTDLRRRWAAEWDEKVAEAREIPGFERFLHPVPFEELRRAAADGPVVILNVSRYGTHAIIVRHEDAPEVIALPEMSFETMRSRANRFREDLERARLGGEGMRARIDRERARRSVLGCLEWLWDSGVATVLERLGYFAGSFDESRRFWWCPTGPASLLPLHAAGRYPKHASTGRLESGVGSSDYAVVAYTTTLTSLIRTFDRSAISTGGSHLLVGVDSSPGMKLSPLEGAIEEIRRVEAQLSRVVPSTPLVNMNATVPSVAGAIASHSSLHLACHGMQEQLDPMASGFVLWDGVLTIGELISQHTADRDLAFLSACETSTGAVAVLDEGMHLAACMQFLGYRQVLATSWYVSDRIAPYVAERVYKVMTEGRWRPELALIGLHGAVSELRKSQPENPILWGTYVAWGR